MDENALEKLKRALAGKFAPVSQPNPYAPSAQMPQNNISQPNPYAPSQQNGGLAEGISNSIYNLTGKRDLNDNSELEAIKKRALERLLGK